MADMGMHMEGMDMGSRDHAGQQDGGYSNPMGLPVPGRHDTPHMTGMHDMSDSDAESPCHSPIPGSIPVPHASGHHGTGNQSVAEYSRQRLNEPGIGLENTETRVLVYTDLKSHTPYPDRRKPVREIEIHLTDHMTRYMWLFDGKKYSEAKAPIRFHYGERLPRKHTLVVKPAEHLSVAIKTNAPGRWAFHCHLLLHMEAGMFRIVEVTEDEPEPRS